MKIALIGHGKMGREVEMAAIEAGDQIVEIFDSRRPLRLEVLAAAEVCIDFSTPPVVLDNIRAVASAKKDLVVGTTGWTDRLADVREWFRESGMVHSANFSLGMNLFFRIVDRAAELVNNAQSYDVFVHEFHHRQKKDSPSGTALHLARLVLERTPRKTKVQSETSHGPIPSDHLHVSSTRAGTIAGTHLVGFDSDADSIELKHTAKNRRGFALGALAAAHWVRGRRGVFTMDDVEL